MKLTRNDLKALVREVIVEVLTEGLGETLVEARNDVHRQRDDIDDGRLNETRQGPPRRHAVDPRKVLAEKERLAFKHAKRVQPTAIDQAVNEVAGKDDVMRSILADTARTTLPTLLSGDRPGAMQPMAHGVEERIVEAAEPEQLFGEDVVGNWANLAFQTTRPGR